MTDATQDALAELAREIEFMTHAADNFGPRMRAALARLGYVAEAVQA